MPKKTKGPASPEPPAPAVASVNPEKLVTLAALAQRGPLTYSQLRWQMFHRNANGLARAVVKIGRRTFIDLDRFAEWLASQREVA